ncbi:unnamed protein product [Miscanthus lutarioriparius]|uniref:Uncharacterized protein n=1 Tax=Miscanthus lutarioriparius TaxID=422564 RepID=A0A811MVF1_9POAL|nr:unnamed protein product [Miscanthus lutarioriparius]
MDVADGCHGRRGAVWRAACFLSYADTNASTAREDAFRGWFYDDNSADGDDTPTAALGRECVANRTAAECSRCLNESAKVVPALKEGRRKRKLSLVHGDAVVVVGYSCYLRVPLFPPMPRWETYGELTRSVSVSFLSKKQEIGAMTMVLVLAVFGVFAVFDVVGVVLIEVVGLLFCIEKAREFNPA